MDIISVSMVCKSWRSCFKDTMLDRLYLKANKEKKRKKRLVCILENIKKEWVKLAIKFGAGLNYIILYSIKKSYRPGIESMRFHAEITTIPNNEVTKHSEDGNSLILVMDITYWNWRRTFDWDNALNFETFAKYLQDYKKWDGNKYVPKPTVRVVGELEIAKLGL
eukprot:Phypoly_transcript_18984.p1 GENE.Phypoly_transcript_18984~~Phypoly_transcript_18984.p1  ORF type:complete len:186 (+),score=20.70 Phypoly_transcript_18984:65-559(+)